MVVLSEQKFRLPYVILVKVNIRKYGEQYYYVGDSLSVMFGTDSCEEDSGATLRFNGGNYFNDGADAHRFLNAIKDIRKL